MITPNEEVQELRDAERPEVDDARGSGQRSIRKQSSKDTTYVLKREGLKSILDSVGIEVDNDLAGKVVNNLKGKNLEELMAEGWFLVLSKLLCTYGG